MSENQKQNPAELQATSLHMQQTILMLNLAVAQISFSMTQGDDSVNALSRAFTEILNIMTSVAQHAEGIQDSDPIKSQIQEEFAKVEHQMREIVIAFQFYDKLSQRLSHVSNSLGSLAEIIGDDKQLYSSDSWVALQSYIRSKYTMQEEVDMFDAILQGHSVEQALRLVAEAAARAEDDDIELF